MSIADLRRPLGVLCGLLFLALWGLRCNLLALVMLALTLTLLAPELPGWA